MRIATLSISMLLLTACSPVDLLNLASGSDAVEETANLSYGPLPRHKYDLYTPKQLPDDAPLILFVHGGSWEDGSKDIYRFLGTAYGDAGYEMAVINYRLSPEVIFPRFVEDAALALHHILDTAEGRPVFVMGHSAGAQIGGLLAWDDRYLAAFGRDTCEIAGFIGLAGPYDFLPLLEDRYRRIFPESIREQSQPIAYAAGAAAPSLLLHGTGDSTVHAEDTELMRDALLAAGNSVDAKLYDGVGHIEIMSANSTYLRDSAPTFEDVTGFIEAQRIAGYPGCG